MKVLNKKNVTDMTGKVYIGRPSLFGNPYVIGKDGDRDEVIDKYEKYVLNCPKVLSKLSELGECDLVCYCAPLRCHGDVLVKIKESISYQIKPHTLAIVGSRWYNDYSSFKTYLEKAITILNIEFNKIISGGANGPDRMAIRYAKEKGIEWTEYPAEWNRYGKKAGFIRNTTIVENATYVLAFWDRKSSGTFDTIEKCAMFNKEVHIININKIGKLNGNINL